MGTQATANYVARTFYKKDHWICACGQWNHRTRTQCLNCAKEQPENAELVGSNIE